MICRRPRSNSIRFKRHDYPIIVPTMLLRFYGLRRRGEDPSRVFLLNLVGGGSLYTSTVCTECAAKHLILEGAVPSRYSSSRTEVWSIARCEHHDNLPGDTQSSQAIWHSSRAPIILPVCFRNHADASVHADLCDELQPVDRLLFACCNAMRAQDLRTFAPRAGRNTPGGRVFSGIIAAFLVEPSD